MTVKEFLKKSKATEWYELHWSLASTLEQTQIIFERNNVKGTIYQVPYGWWCVTL